MGDCETSSEPIRAHLRFEPAAVLVAVNVVRPVGRSTFDGNSGPPRVSGGEKEVMSLVAKSRAT